MSFKTNFLSDFNIWNIISINGDMLYSYGMIKENYKKLRRRLIATP